MALAQQRHTEESEGMVEVVLDTGAEIAERMRVEHALETVRRVSPERRCQRQQSRGRDEGRLRVRAHAGHDTSVPAGAQVADRMRAARTAVLPGRHGRRGQAPDAVRTE